MPGAADAIDPRTVDILLQIAVHNVAPSIRGGIMISFDVGLFEPRSSITPQPTIFAAIIHRHPASVTAPPAIVKRDA